MVEMLISHRDNKPTVPIESKILLTLDEAQGLTELSKGYLKDAIQQGKLNAQVIGKSWRVKRNDLDEFVEELFGTFLYRHRKKT